MRKILLTLLAIFSGVMVSFAQEKDVTKFLGIPVDGTKSEMIWKLKQKGFTADPYDKDVLRGEFNGYNVKVSVVTNNNKVYRVFVQDASYVSETNIRIRFNKLCRQFDNNKRYMKSAIADDKGYEIPAEEDISYQMSVKNKRYEATYWQTPDKIDTTAVQQEMMARVMEKYSQEELENASEDLQAKILLEVLSYTVDYMSKRSVWFMIDERFGSYGILMYYDNEYNRANGEDL